MTTSSSEQLVYEWLFNSQKIKTSDKRFKNSNTNEIEIDCFECKYVGTYKCFISTTNQPTVSMSAKMKLNIQGEWLTQSYSSAINVIVSIIQNLQATSMLIWVTMIFYSTSTQTVFLIKSVRCCKVRKSWKRYSIHLSCTDWLAVGWCYISGISIHHNIDQLTQLVYIILFILEKEITAKDFNLSCFESWSLELDLTAKEKKSLQVLLGMCSIRLLHALKQTSPSEIYICHL